MKMLGKVGRYKNKLRHRWFDGFYFIHINKTGGSSVEEALKIPFEHKTAKEKIFEVGLESWEKRFCFSFVRNPWDKVVSHYHYRVKTNQSGLSESNLDFVDWVKVSYRDKEDLYYDNPKMFMNQCSWLVSDSGDVAVDYIGRFESLSSDFNTVASELGLKTTLPHLKKTKRMDYRNYYNDEAAEIVASVFARDIDYFGYSF